MQADQRCPDTANKLAVPIVEFEGGAKAVFYASRTLAHGHETTEVIGTAGKLLVGEHAVAALGDARSGVTL